VCLAKASTKRRNIIIAIILIVAIGVSSVVSFIIFFEPSLVNLPTVTHYGDKVGQSGANPVGFDLTMYSPTSQKNYAGTIPLNFNVRWEPFGVSTFFNWTFSGIYTYSIDNKPAVSLQSNQSASDFYGYGPNASRTFKYNPSFSYLIDISNLENGRHRIVISAGLYYNQSGYLYQLFNESSSPFSFSVQN